MIKVINITSDKNIGGAGRCILNFLKYYDRENFRVKVVVPRDSLLIPEIKRLNTEVIEVNGIADKSFDLKAIGNISKVIKKLSPDIVHTHGTLSGRISSKICGKKTIYTRHSVFPVSPKISKGIGKSLNKKINEYFADDIIAVAEAAKDNLTEGGIAPEKIKVILNGVERVEKLSDSEILELKKEYNIDSDDFVIGILARLEDVKGHIYLLEATEKLIKSGNRIKVLIAGTGGIEKKLEKMIKDKGLQDNVVMTGFVKDIHKILNIMNIQANASYGTEATSLALLEGMSLGIPSIVSNYGGNPGVISHGENGFIFKLKDSEDMAKYLAMIIKDKELFEKMKSKSIEIFNKKFTAEIYARNIEDVYLGVMGKTRGEVI